MNNKVKSIAVQKNKCTEDKASKMVGRIRVSVIGIMVVKNLYHLMWQRSISLPRLGDWYCGVISIKQVSLKDVNKQIFAANCIEKQKCYTC